VTPGAHPIRETLVRDRLIGRFSGRHDGPRLIVVGALHGNEPAGAIAARRVLSALEHADPDAIAGSLVALVGNLRACNDPNPDTRYIETDLNRAFTPHHLQRAATLPDDDLGPEELELRDLTRLLDREITDRRTVLVDLHTTSAPSPPFIAMEDTLAARRVARSLPLPIILGLEEELPGLLFDYVTNHHRIVSFVVESGQHDDPESVTGHEAVIWTLLDALGVLPIEGGPVAHQTDPRQVLRAAAGELGARVFDVRHREAIIDEGYQTLEQRGAFERVTRHRTPIAHQGGRTLTPPISGQLFMPNRQPIKQLGDDAYFIVRELSPGWLGLSARLRRSRRLERWIPRLLPGVRRRPGRPDELLVAPDIAVVLKRQLLHLLGYRLIRRSHVLHLSRPARVWGALRALVHAAFTLAGGAFRGGERAALGAERDDDWVITRRTLDRDPPPDNPGTLGACNRRSD
jgi:succinylglutamate desuccinylase